MADLKPVGPVAHRLRRHWGRIFGGGRTKEIGETEDSIRVEFEMAHPVFGRTLAYTGSCRFKSQ